MEENWAPDKKQDCDVQRAFITVRRTNHNIFRMIRDAFDINPIISTTGKGVIKTLASNTSIYSLHIVDTHDCINS